MYPLDQLTNAAQPVTLAGRSYPVRQLRLREWGELQAWLKGVAPSPIAVAARGIAELKAAGMPVSQDQQDAIYRQAQAEARTWPPRVASAEWFRALDQIEGAHARLVMAALAAGGTDVTEDDAADIAAAATSAELIDLVRVCVHGQHPVPKAAGEATPPATSSPTTGDRCSITSTGNAGSPPGTSPTGRCRTGGACPIGARNRRSSRRR